MDKQVRSEEPAPYLTNAPVPGGTSQLVWWPVAQALPPYETPCLLTVRDYESYKRRVVPGWRHSTQRRGEVWHGNGGELMDEVIAWSLVPEPFQGPK